jgi:RibD C-terminal domain
MSPPSTRGFRWTTGSAIDQSLSGPVAGFDWSGNRPGPTVEVPTGKVIISTHITVDGVIGPSPEGWAILEGEGERYKFDQLMAADAFLLGRKVYEGLAGVWPTITDDTGFADRVNGIPKYVASRTLEEPLEWNASLITGELAESVTSLKARHRGNLISFRLRRTCLRARQRGTRRRDPLLGQPRCLGQRRPGLPRPPGPDAPDRDDRVRLGRRPSLLPSNTECAGERNDLTRPCLSVRG